MRKTKTCTKCKEAKPLSAYSTRKDSGVVRLRGECKTCVATRLWHSHLKRKYGLTLAQFNAVLAKQEGRCALCRTTKWGDDRKSNPHVDHNHATGVVRGLLCHRCNVAIAFFDDDIDKLRAAISYLSPGENHQLAWYMDPELAYQ